MIILARAVRSGTSLLENAIASASIPGVRPLGETDALHRLAEEAKGEFGPEYLHALTTDLAAKQRYQRNLKVPAPQSILPQLGLMKTSPALCLELPSATIRNKMQRFAQVLPCFCPFWRLTFVAKRDILLHFVSKTLTQDFGILCKPMHCSRLGSPGKSPHTHTPVCEAYVSRKGKGEKALSIITCWAIAPLDTCFTAPLAPQDGKTYSSHADSTSFLTHQGRVPVMLYASCIYSLVFVVPPLVCQRTPMFWSPNLG